MGKDFIAQAERDSRVIVSLRMTLEAMEITHGSRITMAGVAGVLNYSKEIRAVREALTLLGADPDEPLSKPASGAAPR